MSGHLQVRAFAEWPGTVMQLRLVSSDGKSTEELVKIVESAVASDHVENVSIEGRRLLLPCKGSPEQCLEVLQIQPQNKRAMDVASFINGLNGKTVELV